MKRNIERRLKIRNNLNKKLILLRDYNQKWTKRDKYYKRREDKRRNISKKCYSKMKDKRLKQLKKEKKRDKKIFKPKRNIQECLRNKNKIVLMNSKQENNVLKNL